MHQQVSDKNNGTSFFASGELCGWPKHLLRGGTFHYIALAEVNAKLNPKNVGTLHKWT